MNLWPAKKLIQFSVALSLIFATTSPITSFANPVEECVGNVCTVSFSFVGSVQSYSPPQNATSLRFEAYGAQGGKSGGGGGKVTGTFSIIPEILYIAVGGAGSSGSSAPGGYNGGGIAGAASGMEGSGGGATDLRLTPDISSRVVVAGGGGGRGAGLGSNGGAGGGLTAADGKTAQGFGGKGGSQVSGGLGGAQNGSGTAGSAGSLGVGGTGGQSSLHGGGGGGGGYFGGGGGGSDTDSCCTDAGGGGGGSSYTDPMLISAVSHTTGARAGSGALILTYELPQAVMSFGPTQSLSNQAQVDFQLELGTPLAFLDPNNFVINHSAGNCALVEVAGSDSSFTVSAVGCDDGLVSLTFNTGSLFSNEQFPSDQSFTTPNVLIDSIAPALSFAESSANSSIIVTQEPLFDFDFQDLILQTDEPTCQLSQLVQSSNLEWEVSLVGCEATSYQLGILAMSISDQAGNLAPNQTLMTSFSAFTDPAPEPTPEPTQTSAPTPIQSSQPEAPSQSEPPNPNAPAQENPESPAENLIAAPQAPLVFDTPVSIEPITPTNGTNQTPELDSSSSSSPVIEELPEPVADVDGIVSQPASKPRQSAQRLLVAEQESISPFGANPWVPALVFLGVFALLIGIFVSRKVLPSGTLS